MAGKFLIGEEPSSRTHRGTIQLSEEEKNALRFVAGIRNETEGAVLRAMTPPQVLVEYERLKTEIKDLR